MADEEDQDIILLSSDDESKPQVQVSMGSSRKTTVNYSMARKNMQTEFASQVVNYKTSVSAKTKASYVKSSQIQLSRNVYSFPKSQNVFNRENRTSNNIVQRPLNNLKQTAFKQNIPQSAKCPTNIRSANSASQQYRRNDQMNSVVHPKRFEKIGINKNVNMVPAVVSKSNFSSRPPGSGFKATVSRSSKNITPLNISAFKSNSRTATPIKLDVCKSNLTSTPKVTQNVKSSNIKTVPSSVITALQKKGISVTNVITESNSMRKSEPKLQASATKQQVITSKLQASAAKQQTSVHLDKLKQTSKNNCFNFVASAKSQNNLQSNYNANMRSGSISQRNPKRKVEDTVNTPNKFPKLACEPVRNIPYNPRNGMVLKVGSRMNATKILPVTKLSTANNVPVKAPSNFQCIPNNCTLIKKDGSKSFTSKIVTNKAMPSVKQPIMVNSVKQIPNKAVTIIAVQQSKNLPCINNAAKKTSESCVISQRKPLPFIQTVIMKEKQQCLKNTEKIISVPSSSTVSFPSNLSLSIIPVKSVEKVLNKNTNNKISSEPEIIEISKKKSLKSLVGTTEKSKPTPICRNIDLSKDRSALLSLIASSSSTGDNKLSTNESIKLSTNESSKLSTNESIKLSTNESIKLPQTAPKAENNSLNKPVISKSFNKLDISKAVKDINVPIHLVDQSTPLNRNIRSFKLCDALKEVESWPKPVVRVKRVNFKLSNSGSKFDELHDLSNLVNKSKLSKSTNPSKVNAKLVNRGSVKNQTTKSKSINKAIKQHNTDAQLIYNDPDLEKLLSFLDPVNETAVPCVADAKLTNADSNLEIITYSNLEKLLNLSNPVKEATNQSKMDDKLNNKDSSLEKSKNLSNPVGEAINPSKVHDELIKKDSDLEKQKNILNPVKEASNLSAGDATSINIDSDLKKLKDLSILVKEGIKSEAGAELSNKCLNSEKLKNISSPINEASNLSDGHAKLINIDSDLKKLKDLSISVNEAVNPSKYSAEFTNKDLQLEKLKNLSNPVNKVINPFEGHAALINLDCDLKKLRDLSISVNEAVDPSKAGAKLVNKDFELKKQLSNPVKEGSNPSEGNSTLISIDSDLKKLRDLSISFDKTNNRSEGVAALTKIDSDLKKLRNFSISVNETIIPPEADAILTNRNLSLKERELRNISNQINEASNTSKSHATLIKSYPDSKKLSDLSISRNKEINPSEGRTALINIDSDLKKLRDLSITLNKKPNPSEGHGSLINIDSDLKKLRDLSTPVNKAINLHEGNTVLTNIDSNLKKQQDLSISVNEAIYPEVGAESTSKDFDPEKLNLPNTFNEANNSSDGNATTISIDSDLKKLRHLLVSVHEVINPTETDVELTNKDLNLEKLQTLYNPDNDVSNSSEGNSTLINIDSDLKKLKDPVNEAIKPSECDTALINIDSDLKKLNDLSIPVSEAVNSSKVDTKLISCDANLDNLRNLTELDYNTTVPSLIKVDSGSVNKASNFDKQTKFSISVNGAINLSETTSELLNKEYDFQNSLNPVGETVHSSKTSEVIHNDFNSVKLRNSSNSFMKPLKLSETDDEIYVEPSSREQQSENSSLCKSENILCNLLKPVILLERIAIPPNVSCLKNYLEKLPPKTSANLLVTNKATDLTLLEGESNSSSSLLSKINSKTEICHKSEKLNNQILNESLLKSPGVCENQVINIVPINSENSYILGNISTNLNEKEKHMSSLDLQLHSKSSDINKSTIDLTAGTLPSKDTIEKTLNIELDNILTPQKTYSSEIHKTMDKSHNFTDSSLPNHANKDIKKYPVCLETKCRPWTVFNSGVLSIENTADFFMRPQNISEITVKNVLNNIISNIEKCSSAQFSRNLSSSSENSSHSIPPDEFKIKVSSPKPSQTECFTNTNSGNNVPAADLEKVTKISSEVYSAPSCQKSAENSKISSLENKDNSSTIELNAGVSKSSNKELIDNFKKPPEMSVSLQNVDKDVHIVKLLNDESLTAVPRAIKMLCDSVSSLEDIVEETCRRERENIANIDIISSRSEVEIHSHTTSTEISEEKCGAMSDNFELVKEFTVKDNSLSTQDVSMAHVLNLPIMFEDTSKTIDPAIIDCVCSIISELESSQDMEIENDVYDNSICNISSFMSDTAGQDEKEVEDKGDNIVEPKVNEVDDKSTNGSSLVTDTVNTIEIEVDDNCSFNVYSTINDAIELGENQEDSTTEHPLCTSEMVLNMEIEDNSDCEQEQDLMYDHENALNKIENELEKPRMCSIGTFDFGKAKQTDECSNMFCDEEKNDSIMHMDLDEQITSPKLSLKRKKTEESPENKVHPAIENGHCAENRLKRVKMDFPSLLAASTQDQVKQISSPKTEVPSDEFCGKEYNRKKYFELLEYSKTLMRGTPETEKSKIVKNMMRQLDATEMWYSSCEIFSNLLDSSLVDMKKKSEEVFIILSQLRKQLKSFKSKSKGLKIESGEESNLSFTTRTSDKNFEANQCDSFPVASSSGLAAPTLHTKSTLNDDVEESSHSSFSVQISPITCQPTLETVQNSVLSDGNTKNLKFDSDNSVSNQGLSLLNTNIETFNDYVKNQIAGAIDSTSDSVSEISANKSSVSGDKINENSNSCLNASSSRISETVKPRTVRKLSSSESCPSSSNVSNPLVSKSNLKDSLNSDPIDFASVKNLSLPTSFSTAISSFPNNLNKEKDCDVNPSIVESESLTKPTKFNDLFSESFAATTTPKAGSDKSSFLDRDPFLVEASKHITQSKLDDAISKINEAASKTSSKFQEASSSKFQEATSSQFQEPLLSQFQEASSSKSREAASSSFSTKEKLKDEQRHVARIARLVKKLEDLDRKIKKLQKRELSLDDLDDDDSAYMKEELYKKRFMKVHQIYCDLIKEPFRTGRIVEKKFFFEGSRFTVINDAVKRMINKKKSGQKFPNYPEVHNLIKKVNFNADIGLSDRDVEIEAERVFKDIGGELKSRRIRDHEDLMGCYLTDGLNLDDDPAEHDPEMQRKLHESSQKLKKSTDEIFNKYVSYQEQGINVEEDNSKSADEDNSDKESSSEEPIDDDDLPDVDSHTLSKDVESLPDKDGDKSGDEEPEKVFSIIKNLPMDEDSLLPPTDVDSPATKGFKVSNSDDDVVVIFSDSEKSTEPNEDVDIDCKKIAEKSTDKNRPKTAYSFQNTVVHDEIVIVNDSSNELPEIEDIITISHDA